MANIEKPRKNKVTTGNSNENTFVVLIFPLQILTWRYINLRPAGCCRGLSSPNICPVLIRLIPGVSFVHQGIEVRRHLTCAGPKVYNLTSHPLSYNTIQLDGVLFVADCSGKPQLFKEDSGANLPWIAHRPQKAAKTFATVLP